MNTMKKIGMLLVLVLTVFALSVPALAAPQEDTAPETETTAVAEEAAEAESQSSVTSMKAIASAIAIGLCATGGAIGMGMLGSNAVQGIARQPEAESKIRTTLMLSLVFIETAIIYALLVVIMIIFVL